MSLVFGYAAGAGRAAASGMRVHEDGRVELLEPGSDWRQIATLTGPEVDELAARTRAAGVPDLPAEVPRPSGLHGGGECELWSDLDGRSVHSVIHGWTEVNEAAQPTLELVLALSGLVSAAQARG